MPLRRHPLIPWYVGLAVIIVAVAFVGYEARHPVPGAVARPGHGAAGYPDGPAMSFLSDGAGFMGTRSA